VNRRALLAVLAASGACVAFGVAGAAFGPSIPADAPSPDLGDGPAESYGGGGGGGERLADRNIDSGTAGCVLCGLNARSLVAGLVPSVDPLAWAAAAAVVAAGAWVAGLRRGGADPPGVGGPPDGDSAVRSGESTPSGRRVPPDAPAENGVYRAWASLTERVAGSAPAAARTPRSVAREAVDAGFDPDAVARLTALFEHVRYGPTAATDERERAAREALADADDGEEP